jgi:hypothetical protein
VPWLLPIVVAMIITIHGCMFIVIVFDDGMKDEDVGKVDDI